MQVALFRGVFFPDRGLGLRAEHLGARPGSLDRGRTLFGTKGKRTGNSTGAQAGLEKFSVNPGPAVKQEGVWHRKSSVNPGHAVKQEGVWRRKSSVNPGPAVKQEGVWLRKSSVNPGPAVKQGGVWRKRKLSIW